MLRKTLTVCFLFALVVAFAGCERNPLQHTRDYIFAGFKPPYDDNNGSEGAKNSNVVCYISKTGSRYHSIPNCSGASLIPIYSVADVPHSLSPCGNCWNKAPLF